MADFRLGRLKFNWRGDWQASTAYVIDDIVAFKGNTYVCVVNHTSAASETTWASTDLNISTPRWQLHVPGIRIMGQWSPSTFYAKNDLVSYGASQYLCNTDHTSVASETQFYDAFNILSWDLYLSGAAPVSVNDGEWQAGEWYKVNDIVKYGNTLYRTTTGHTSGIQFDSTKFAIYLESVNFENTWNSGTEYQPGDIVNFGGYTYIANTINSNKQPNIFNIEIPGVGGNPPTPADWNILTTGFDVKGEYDNATVYVPGDVVQFGGNTYVKLITGNAGVYPTDTSAWELVSSGLNWRGPWNSSNTYQVNDVVSSTSASWVCLTPHNINIDPVADQTNTGGTNWQALAQGESTLTLSNPGDILFRNNGGANVNLAIGSNGETLTVDANGLPAWERSNWCANVYYVATDGTDDPAYGKNISKPWASLRYALTQTANQGTADNIVTIFVKSGAYEEQLPLITTPYTSIVGDNLRATIIKPDPNTQSTDATPVENRFSTMFFLSESVTLKDLVMVGMEGYSPASGTSNDWDITQGTIRGVFLRLHPNDPITGKSPYITQCSAFSGRPLSSDANSNGGVGALIDKSIYGATTSNGSMLFDSFTQFHDGGVGFWCKDLGNAEIVSSFTYYAQIGYTCTGGGRIRSLAGNNSYGTYGCVSSGYDLNETALTGKVRGQRLNFTYNENSPVFKQYEEVTQGTDDGNGNIDYTTTNANYALGLILYVQPEYLIIEPITGTFGNNLPIKGTGAANVVASAAEATTPASNALEGLSGKIFTLTNLPVVSGAAVLPKPTGSVKFENVVGQSAYDDPNYYVIREVTDPATAQNLTLTATRQYDTPGAAPLDVDISTIAKSGNTVTITTSTSHGLSSGDEVVIVIANAVYQQYASGAYERETVTVIDGTSFSYQKAVGSDISPAVALGGSKVYLQSSSGGSTKALHPGGSDVNLYKMGGTTRLDRAGTQALDTTTTSITFADTAILASMTAGSNNFILIGNELCEITAINAGLGVSVNRASEGTTAAEHADGSNIYYITKTSAATTLRGDIDTAVTEIPVFSISGFSANDVFKVNNEFFRIDAVNSALVGQATIIFSQPKNIDAVAGQDFEIRLNYSQVRLTGHDFLLIGTGDKTNTNWPDTPLQDALQDNEVKEDFPGRVYYVSTDQDGNFRVGEFFKVEQATGTATLDANAFNLSGLAGLRLGTIGAQLGEEINEFSSDTTLGGDFARNNACPTQLAVKTYVDGQTGAGISRTAPTIGVAQLASSGTTATVTSYVAHNVFQGDEIQIAGANEANYNGRFVVTSIDPGNKQFTYTMPASASSPATGAITCERYQRMSTELTIEGNLQTKPVWNDSSTVFKAIDIDITDTLSQTTSKLIDITVSGQDKFSVDKSGNVVAAGSLTVQGDLTTVSSTNLSITDKEIIIGNGATDATSADGAGLVVGSSGKSFKYDNSNSRWNLTDAINVGGNGLSISGVQVLSQSTLGSGVTGSSLTSVGTLTGLAVGGISHLKSVRETIETRSANQSGTQTYNYETAAIFYHPSVSGNITPAITNVPTTQDQALALNFIFVQGGSGYRITDSIGINGTNYTVKWTAATAPSPSSNRTDIFTISIVNTAGTWEVYGQMSNFA